VKTSVVVEYQSLAKIQTAICRYDNDGGLGCNRRTPGHIHRADETQAAVTPTTHGDRSPSGTIPTEGEPNGKVIRSSRAFEEGTGKSTAGSPTFYCRARRLGKRRLQRSAHIISRRAYADQSCPEEAMGKGSEWIEASSGNGYDSCQTHTKNLSSRQKENCGCRTRTLGEVQSGEEEIGGVLTLGARCESRGGLSRFRPNSDRSVFSAYIH
jgi:hypothetical protein